MQGLLSWLKDSFRALSALSYAILTSRTEGHHQGIVELPTTFAVPEESVVKRMRALLPSCTFS